ncbi:hypothetical protein QYE76_041086 [Lolium multiflorum]|uniref:Retrotransposon gag domain-containing protein n=1 Tax=Lolium multiflorum TaxID=4521 RepID=A0AAD8WW22_LOLMU|nr:hypothetical protein QYE76_041086 [Lolium multiflorum]
MRDEFRELKQGRMTVVEYRDKFLTLSRYAHDEANAGKRKEVLNAGALQMEGKLNQANENRKRENDESSGPDQWHKFRPKLKREDLPGTAGPPA